MADTIVNQPTQSYIQITDPSGQALIQFVDNGVANPTIWLLDEGTKTLIPFTSRDAFQNMFGGLTPEDVIAMGKVTPIPSSYVNTPNSGIYGYTLLRGDQGVQSDGTIPGASLKVDSSKISNFYGKQKNDESSRTGLQIVNGLLDVAAASDLGINQAFLTKVKNDASLLGFYVNALVYGEYQAADMLADLKRRAAIDSGNNTLQNVKIIDEATPASQYRTTNDYANAISNPALALPNTLKGQDISVYRLPIYQLSNDVFKTLVQPFDPTTPEGKAEIEKISAAYYDILVKQYEADTESKKALADTEYKRFQEVLDKNYGIKLSDDAMTAWNQIQSLGQAASVQGLAGSGYEQEAIDDYLKTVRKTDQRIRESHLTEEEDKRISYYIKSASPKQIQDDLSSGKITAQNLIDWGLKPTPEQLQYFSEANLKAQFPNLTDKEIQDYHNSIIDEYGNYRSDLYKTLYQNKYATLGQKSAYQQTTLLNKKLDEEQSAWDKIKGAANQQTTVDTTTETATPAIQTPSTPPSGATVNNSSGTSGSTQTGDWSKVKNVFGQGWTPSPAAKGLAAVRVGGYDKVYVINPDGTTKWVNADEYKNLFGSSSQSGIVGEINTQQANALGITDFGNPVSVASTKTSTPPAPIKNTQNNTQIGSTVTPQQNKPFTTNLTINSTGGIDVAPPKTSSSSGINQTGGNQGANMFSSPLGVSTANAATAAGKIKKSLIDIYNSRPDVQSVVNKNFSGQDPFRSGTAANAWLNSWWNTSGQKENPNVTLI